MKRIAAVIVGAALVLSATSAQAQKGTLFLIGTGGAALPMGDFKDAGAKTGWMAAGGLGYDLTNNLFIAGVYRYGAFGTEGGGDDTKLSGPEGSLGYSFGAAEAKIHPYVRAGFGLMKPKVGDLSGDGKSNISGAFGLFMPKGKGGWFVEGQYNTLSSQVDGGSSSNYLVASVGFTWALKAGK